MLMRTIAGKKRKTQQRGTMPEQLPFGQGVSASKKPPGVPVVFKSGRHDSNVRPLRPERSALARLSYAPLATAFWSRVRDRLSRQEERLPLTRLGDNAGLSRRGKPVIGGSVGLFRQRHAEQFVVVTDETAAVGKGGMAPDNRTSKTLVRWCKEVGAAEFLIALP